MTKVQKFVFLSRIFFLQILTELQTKRNELLQAWCYCYVIISVCWWMDLSLAPWRVWVVAKWRYVWRPASGSLPSWQFYRTCCCKLTANNSGTAFYELCLYPGTICTIRTDSFNIIITLSGNWTRVWNWNFVKYLSFRLWDGGALGVIQTSSSGQISTIILYSFLFLFVALTSDIYKHMGVAFRVSFF